VRKLIQSGFFARRALPVFLQAEASECGLACVAMVGAFHGHEIDMTSARRRFPISSKGVTFRTLIDMARRLSLQARPVKVELDGLAQIRTPCILHWEMKHFVVLKRATPRHVVIVDPAVGERRLAWPVVSRSFTGVALELWPENSFQAIDDRPSYTLRSLAGKVTGLKSGLLKLFCLGVLLQVCALVVPFNAQWVIDYALVDDDTSLVNTLAVGFVLLMLFQAFILFLKSWITAVITTDFTFQWLGRTFGHLLRLPMDYFERRHLGDVASRFASIQLIQQSITVQLVDGVLDALLVLGAGVLLFVYSPALGAISVAATLAYAAARGAFVSPQRAATTEQIVSAAQQQAYLLETVRCMQGIKLFNRTETRRVGWMNKLAEQCNAQLRIARISTASQSISALIFGIERVVVVWAAAHLVMDTRFSVGMLFAYLSYREQFSARVASLIDKVYDIQLLKLHGERVADIVMSRPEADVLSDGETDGSVAASSAIDVHGLDFRYSDSDPWMFNGLSLNFADGECVALTGSSGCGKTTFVKLLLGLLEADGGYVSVAGVPIRKMGIGNFREMVGTVMQEDQLLTGTIAENICFFDPSPDFERIEECALMSAIDEEISRMPMGYNTLVGDVGAGLSGGQKQRILLARALYRKPRILVLDEATSNLDVPNERTVMSAVKKLRMTRIVVAHRPETIAMADRVLRFEPGKGSFGAVAVVEAATPRAATAAA